MGESCLYQMSEILKGILEGCILEIISHGETYGYEITQQLHRLGFDDVVEGTVYTITTRLERQNLVVVERKNSDLGPPRKFYRLNEAGQCRRKEFWDKWDFISARCEQLRKK